MTRAFNNQRREYPRKDSRGSSSRRFKEERPSRPARPRLNRDRVDRAWENGASRNHADYRTRSDSKSQSTRDNRRPNQQTNRYSAQGGNHGRKPYGKRQDDYHPGEHSPRINNGSRPRTFESNKRSSRSTSGPATHNPRQQSSRKREQNNYSNKPHRYSRFEAEQELFEGDYEQFDSSNSAQPYTHRNKVDTYASHRPAERSVTRLPNGRVLKGTPDEQHRKAEFWNEISQESDELLKQVESSHAQKAATKHPADPPTSSSSRRKTTPRTHEANRSRGERKTTNSKMRQRSPKPRSTGPRPSQRGFKWPTREG
jgi:hypothetical protein